MKIILALAGAAAIGATAPAAGAIEIIGGSLDAQHLQFQQDSQYGRDAVQGSIEVGITPTFSIQADVNHYNYRGYSTTGNNATLHGIYHVAPQTAVGAFYSHDTVQGSHLNFYGVEGVTTVHNVGLQAYVSRSDTESFGEKPLLYGLSARYAVIPKLGLGVSIQRFDLDSSAHFSRVAATADYSITDSLKLYAAYGRLTLSGSGYSSGEDYISVGARFSFGPDHGVTFEKRGLLDFLPAAI